MALTEWLRQRINNSYDPYANAFTTIETEHHTIHDGKHYFVSGVYDLPLNNVIDIQFTTPNLDKYTHLLFKLDNESELEWYLYEGVTINTAGTAIIPRNNKRSSTNTSVNTVAYIINADVADANADTATAAATALWSGISGSGHASLGYERRDNELILKKNTAYSIRAIATAAGYFDYLLSWYELVM